MDPLDTTNTTDEYITENHPIFGKRRRKNNYYIPPETSSTPESSSSPTINVNNSRLDAFKALEEKQKFKSRFIWFR